MDFKTFLQAMSGESVAVALQVVNAAWLMTALLHDTSLHLGLIMARKSLPQPLLLSGPFRQEPFEAEKVSLALCLNPATVQTSSFSNLTIS